MSISYSTTPSAHQSASTPIVAPDSTYSALAIASSMGLQPWPLKRANSIACCVGLLGYSNALWAIASQAIAWGYNMAKARWRSGAIAWRAIAWGCGAIGWG